MLKATKDHLDQKYIDLVNKGWQFCKDGDFQQGIECLESSLLYKIANSSVLSDIYSELGKAYHSLNDFEQAMEYHRKDIELSIKSNDTFGAAVGNSNLANSLHSVQRYDEAIECHKLYLNVCIESNSKESCTIGYYNLAKGFHDKAKRLGQITIENHNVIKVVYESAISNYQESLSLSYEQQNFKFQIIVLGEIAEVNYMLGHFSESIRFNSEKIRVATVLKDVRSTMNGCIDRGNCFIAIESYEKALSDFENAVSLAKELNKNKMLLQLYYNLSNCHFVLRNYDAAEENLYRLLMICLQTQDYSTEAAVYHCLTMIHIRQEKYSIALLNAKKHLATAEFLNNLAHVEIASENISFINHTVNSPRTEKTVTENESLEHNALLPKLDKSIITWNFDWLPKKDTKNSTVNCDVAGTDTGSTALPIVNLQSEGTKSLSKGKLLDALYQSQSRRMDDQRATIKSEQFLSTPKRFRNL